MSNNIKRNFFTNIIELKTGDVTTLDEFTFTKMSNEAIRELEPIVVQKKFEMAKRGALSIMPEIVVNTLNITKIVDIDKSFFFENDDSNIKREAVDGYGCGVDIKKINIDIKDTNSKDFKEMMIKLSKALFLTGESMLCEKFIYKSNIRNFSSRDIDIKLFYKQKEIAFIKDTFYIIKCENKNFYAVPLFGDTTKKYVFAVNDESKQINLYDGVLENAFRYVNFNKLDNIKLINNNSSISILDPYFIAKYPSFCGNDTVITCFINILNKYMNIKKGDVGHIMELSSLIDRLFYSIDKENLNDIFKNFQKILDESIFEGNKMQSIKNTPLYNIINSKILYYNILNNIFLLFKPNTPSTLQKDILFDIVEYAIIFENNFDELKKMIKEEIDKTSYSVSEKENVYNKAFKYVNDKLLEDFGLFKNNIIFYANYYNNSLNKNRKIETKGNKYYENITSIYEFKKVELFYPSFQKRMNKIFMYLVDKYVDSEKEKFIEIFENEFGLILIRENPKEIKPLVINKKDTTLPKTFINNLSLYSEKITDIEKTLNQVCCEEVIEKSLKEFNEKIQKIVNKDFDTKKLEKIFKICIPELENSIYFLVENANDVNSVEVKNEIDTTRKEIITMIKNLENEVDKFSDNEVYFKAINQNSMLSVLNKKMTQNCF